MNDINPELEEIFQKETILHIENLQKFLQKQEIDSATLHNNYKEFHTITGSSGIVKHNNIMKFSRVITDFCKNLEDSNKTLSNEQIEALLESLDILKKLLDDKYLTIDYKKVIEKLNI